MSKKQKPQLSAFGSAKSFCQMRNASATDEAVIYIYDEIGGWGIWASDFVAALSRITANTIIVRIHCVGGWVDEAIAMHNALRKHPAHIIIEIDSMAASAASFLAQAGDERIIAENARMMIHDVQGIAWGTEAQIRAYADRIPGVREAIIATYDYRTNISADEAREMMTRGTDVYLSAAEAVEMGFVDRIEKLADMGEPPAGLTEDADVLSPHYIDNKGSDITASLNELVKLYGLTSIQTNNSADSGRQDQGKTGDNMDQKQLIAQLLTTGLDVAGLQNQVETLTTERDTANEALAPMQAKHDALVAVIGDRSPEQVTAQLDAASRYTTALVDQIVAGRRLKNLCGDSTEEVDQTREMLNGMSLAHLETEARTFATATAGMSASQMSPAGSDNQDQPSGEADTLADNIINLGTRKRSVTK